ncbi:NapC/NirT family cytochrome c [Rhodoferax sp.]
MRSVMAQRVWKDMMENDSRQCRSRHRVDQLTPFKGLTLH